MNFWRSIAGIVEVELTSADPEATLEAATFKGIDVHSLQKISDLTYRFQLGRGEYKKLAAICEKNGQSLKIIHRQGIYWRILYFLQRPVLATGLLLIISLALFLPSRIYFVKVEGNVTIPARKILSAAEESGITFGASRRAVRSEKTKNALLSAVPELQWAGVNTSGCVAIISVRERTDTVQKEEEQRVQSIVATRDGYILSFTVTQGNGLIAPGQSVQEGQVLISGYTDCGICIRATRAEGEVMAQTSREIEAVMPAHYQKKGELQEVKKTYSLLVGKNRIKLWKDSGICSSSCGRMYEEYYITLPGGFKLPLALCVDTFICCETVQQQKTEEEASNGLTDFANGYLMDQMVSGQILNRDHTVVPDNGVFRLKGTYSCIEMIGKVRQEEIGDTNGKNS